MTSTSQSSVEKYGVAPYRTTDITSSAVSLSADYQTDLDISTQHLLLSSQSMFTLDKGVGLQSCNDLTSVAGLYSTGAELLDTEESVAQCLNIKQSSMIIMIDVLDCCELNGPHVADNMDESVEDGDDYVSQVKVYYY